MKKETNEIHDEIRREALADREESKNLGPIKLILGLFLVIILILWVVPHYYVKDNPHPKYIPDIGEVFTPVDMEKETVNYPRDQYYMYVDSREPRVKAVADKVSSLACDYSENYIVCQSKALFLFVRDRFNYVRDPLQFEYVKTPLESLNNQAGDCDDASVLLASLLGSIGVRTRLVFIPNHVYVEAYLPEASVKYKAYRRQDWVALDATCKNCEFGEMTIKDAKAEKKYVDVT